MGISIQHNMSMINANRQLNVNTKKKAKSAEKLSSGYRINRAADDAAGLSISEKMRWMIRGLNKGTENAQDGVSWVQIGDGSLEETHAMLHRMTELAIKASNETCTDADRAFMQEEFDQLQKEIDRLTDNTYFNEKHIFNEHEYPYYQFEGNKYWEQDEIHTIREGENDLRITYRMAETDNPKTAVITIAAGQYTTRELMDEIDTALMDAGLKDEGIVLSYTDLGTCNLSLEGGEKIDEVDGGLSYLLYDHYGGGSLGALIGTTIFEDNDSAYITIARNKNDTIKFVALPADWDGTDTDPNIKRVDFSLKPGTYTKKKFMELLDEELKAQGTDVRSDHHGTGIMLSSPNYIITEFKGNMFEIDGNLFTSIFYDNIQHYDIELESAEFTGGSVLYTTGIYGGSDPAKQRFHFQNGNNLLVLSPNGGKEITLDLMNLEQKNGSKVNLDSATMADLAAALNENSEFSAANLTAQVYSDPPYPGYYNEQNAHGDWIEVRYVGLKITSSLEGPNSKVGINKAKSTAYDTLFVNRDTTKYEEKAKFYNDSKFDKNIKIKGLRYRAGGLTVKDGVNDSFLINISSTGWQTVKLDANTYADGDALAAEIQDKVGKLLKAGGFDENDIKVTSASGYIQLEGAGSQVKDIQIAGMTGNTGYRDIFMSETLKSKAATYTTRDGKPARLFPEKMEQYKKTDNATGQTYYEIPADKRVLKVQIDGEDKWHEVKLAERYDTLDKLAEAITQQLQEYEQPNIFSAISEEGDADYAYVSTPSRVQFATTNSSINRNLSVRQGDTEYEKADGEGITNKVKRNIPAQATVSGFKEKIGSGITLNDQNKMLSFTLNGTTTVSLDLTQVCGGNSTGDAGSFVFKLQNAVTDALGKISPDKFGGCKVELDGSGNLLFTAGIGVDPGEVLIAKDSSRLSVTTGSGFLYDLYKTEQEAKWSLNGGRETASGMNGSFQTTPTANARLYFNLSTPAGTTEVYAELENNHTYNNIGEVVERLNNELNGKGIQVSPGAGNGLIFSTTEKGTGNDIQIITDTTKSTALKYMFGYQQPDNSYDMKKNNAATAKIQMKVENSIVFGAGATEAERTFSVTVDNTTCKAVFDAGKTYNDRQQFVDDLKTKLNASAAVQGKGDLLQDVLLINNGNGGISFKTKSTNGTSSTIQITYDAGSAMKKVFGVSQVGGAKAVFENDQLVLVREGGDKAAYKSIYATSGTSPKEGGPFILPDVEYKGPTPEPYYYSPTYSTMDGANLILNKERKVDIDKWNNKMTFYYTDNYQGPGATPDSDIRKIDIEIPLAEGSKPGVYDAPKSYTMNELKEQLQNQIDAQAGMGQLEVQVDEKGVLIRAAKSGRKYRIFTNSEGDAYYNQQEKKYRPTGGFYEKVVCRSGIQRTTQKPVNKDGTQSGDKVFAVGRQDVLNKEVRIQKDGNDELSLEFTYLQPGETDETKAQITKLKMKLDPGYYKGDNLVKEVQRQLDKALVEKGLPAGLIEAGIGTVKTNIYGSIDDRALTFKLSKTIEVPDKDGRYGIEAIGGTAAFSIFYQTDGDIAKAFVKGGKDISHGVEIAPGSTDFSVDVDGKTYTINLKPGKYTAQELADHMTELFKNAADPCPLRAMVDDGTLKLMHTKFGKHKITNLKGSLKDDLFFIDKGEKKYDLVHLRLSSVSGDWIDIEKPWMNTVSLGINTCLVSKYKYAQKAITRLKEAVTKVSDVRSYFGATQNRLESTIRNNENKAENTQAAESRIRDADISREVLENSIHSILEQTGASMLAQGKQNSQLVLQMLT